MKPMWFAFVALLTLPLWAAAATLTPESAVEIDFRWLSPPQVAPQTGTTVAEMHGDFTRLAAKFATEGSSYAWPLRYAVPVRNYPIIVLRYSAQNLFASPTDQNTVLQMNLAGADGKNTPAIIIEMQELVQDGVVHEIRKDLSRVAGDTAIDNIRFSFNAPADGGRLDIYELRFEEGPTSVAPFSLPRDAVQFVVTDQNGAAMPDAEIHAGLIERSNWTTIGTTNSAGQVTMPVIRPVRPDGSSPDPVEAMVVKAGYVPQYVAPIEFPRSGPMQVKLTPGNQPGQPAQPTGNAGPVQEPQAQVIGQEPERTVYVETAPTVIYDTSPSVVYVEPYASWWWVPRTYVGYHPYYPYYYHGDHHGYENRHDWYHDRDHYRAGGFVVNRPPTPPPPPPAPRPTPRDYTRDRIQNEVDRGNEPPTGIQDSAIYRKAEQNPRGNSPSAPVPDRGDRYRTGSRNTSNDVARGNEPDARPGNSAPRSTPAPAPRQPAANPQPAPAPTRTPAPAPRQPDRVAPQPAPAPAPAPAPDRGDRYRQNGRGGSDVSRGNEPDARPRAAAPAPVITTAKPTLAREPRLAAPAAASVAPAARPAPVTPRPTPPTVVPQRPPEPVARATVTPRTPDMPRMSMPSPSSVARGNEPAMSRSISVPAPAAARIERAPAPAAPSPAAPRSSSAGDRGARYSR